MAGPFEYLGGVVVWSCVSTVRGGTADAMCQGLPHPIILPSLAVWSHNTSREQELADVWWLLACERSALPIVGSRARVCLNAKGVKTCGAGCTTPVLGI